MEATEKRSQTDAVVDELKRFFLSGDVAVGDKLPTEKQLCETYRVGRSTVREAIRTLQVMGYVELKPGRGAFLAAKEMSRLDTDISAWLAEHKPGVREALRIRAALETLAVHFVAEHGTDEQLHAIDMARLKFEDAFNRRDYEALPQLDAEFHRNIVAAGGSDLLKLLSTLTFAAFDEWRRQIIATMDPSKAVVTHQRIALALMARDPEMAALQVKRHMEQLDTYFAGKA